MRPLHLVGTLAAALATSSTLEAGQVHACIDFSGSGIAAAEQAQIVMKVQTYFSDAGLGPAAADGVTVEDAAANAACEVRVTFYRDAAMDSPYGSTDKQQHTCRANLERFDLNFTGADAVRKCQAISETIAHEIGHALCAVHDCEGTGAKRTVANPQGEACLGTAPTLMTKGSCVEVAKRGHPPAAAGSRAFSEKAKEQIKSGIQVLLAAGPNWDLQAPYDGACLRVVEGRAHLDPVPVGSELTYQEDPLVTFSYEVLSGDQTLFEFGWLNADGAFVEPLPSVANPDALLETRGGVPLRFALRGRTGGPFAGQVIAQDCASGLEFSGQSNPPATAATPGIHSPYHSRATITFVVPGGSFVVALDAGRWGSQNGFQRWSVLEVPALSGPSLVALLSCLAAAGWRRLNARRR